MSVYIASQPISYLPMTDMTDASGLAVMLGTTGGDPEYGIRLCTDTKKFVGVVLYGSRAYNDPLSTAQVQSAGRTATVQKDGIARAIAAGSITRGAAVTVDTVGALGRFKAAATGDIIVGLANTTASGAGKPFELDLSTPIAGATF